ncbi:MAG: site-specific DNA-methyltransferase [Prevotella ruminicola]|jgi:site-specific DNA-methyltransferase (adenine-specific)/adenine-specific DNA-methyltransferase|uniref:Site-specific DNA-methyltransferase n=1 Tax=Xylanibacter ruminicola TaxID=839 RepID=A0A9D5SB62_XYLRU|nr:site-specific DNA-methyltransferase [Xylanibacter ruminicola]
MSELNLKAEQNIESVEDFKFEPIKGQPMLNWRGKRPFTSTQFYPAQLKESFGEETDGWMNKIFWGDNLQVMSHLLKKYRGQVDLIYIDPPFDSKADYKKKIELRGKKAENDKTAFEEKQYTDIWSNDEYLQFMYERLIMLRELLSSNGSIYLHCDWHKSHYLRIIMDEVFGNEYFKNEVVWYYRRWNIAGSSYAANHDTLLYYTKSKTDHTYNQLYIPKSEKSSAQGKSWISIIGEDGVRRSVQTDVPTKGVPMPDVWEISMINPVAKERTEVNYPTQKPEALLERILTVSSNPGDLVFDCFMGSGTTQAVAMKLGRRFIGADINLGAIDTTVKRLNKVAKDINETLHDETRYTGFEVWNVNNYDVFRNPIHAKDLLIEALELQPLPDNGLYDGEKDGRMVKIMPINRIATRVDLNELITGFPRDKFDKRKAETPNKPVELITLVCMGHEPDLGANLKLQMKEEGYNIDVEVVDILRDKVNLEFRRDSEADVQIEGDRLVVREFYPMNLLQKLSLEKTNVDEWRELVDSIKIDFNFDGAVFSPTVIDIPEGKELVKGSYIIPADAGTIKVKITDLLSESCEITLNAE